MTKGFQCAECEFRVYLEVATMIGERVVLLGDCKRCGNKVAVDVEKLFVAFYQKEAKGN